jgi:probable rRNA maturation factor
VPAGSELSVLLATDDAVQALNRQFRRKNKPTDVLSFEQDRATGLLGDIVISLDTAQRQAAEGARPLSEELARLLAHGLLHLLGHDHEEPAAAREMARAEVKLLGAVGLVAEALGATPAELHFRRAHPAPARRQMMDGARQRTREQRR